MSKVYSHGTSAYIEGGFHQLREIKSQLKGFSKWKDGKLFFEPSAANISDILNFIPIDDFYNGIKDRALEVAQFNQEALELGNLKSAPIKIDVESSCFPFKVKPFEHQLEAFSLSKDKKVFAYFMEMGTGKTKVCIDVAAYLYSIFKIDTLVILAPNGVHRQWADEQIPEHIPEFINYQTFVYKSGMGKTKAREFEDVMARRDVLRIICMNAECLSHLSGQNFLEAILAQSKSLLAVDESSRFKNPSSLRTKFLMKAAEAAEYRRIMSGAPLTKGIENLYSQWKILSADVLGFNSFYTFRNRYCVMGGYENKQIIRYKNVDELHRKTEPWSYRKLKKDCLDLPPMMNVTKPFDLTEKQKEIMKEIKKELRTFVGNDNEIAMPLAITRLTKLQQVASGFLIDESKQVHRIMPANQNPRVLAMLEIVKDTEEKILIWARFKEDVKIISEALTHEKIGHIVYNDEGEDRKDKMLRFKTDNACQIFISNQKTGGIGLNLTEASYVIYYTNTFDAEDRWQSEARAYRSGQTKSVTQIDLIANNSGDKKILNVLEQRKELSDIVIDGKKLINDMIEELEEAA